MPVAYDFSSAEFDDAGLNVMECTDGRRFEIRWLPGAPSGENHEVIRELTAHAA